MHYPHGLLHYKVAWRTHERHVFETKISFCAKIVGCFGLFHDDYALDADTESTVGIVSRLCRVVSFYFRIFARNAPFDTVIPAFSEVLLYATIFQPRVGSEDAGSSHLSERQCHEDLNRTIQREVDEIGEGDSTFMYIEVVPYTMAGSVAIKGRENRLPKKFTLGRSYR